MFFADIAGFTSWSSHRDPVEVFTLLESIYSEVRPQPKACYERGTQNVFHDDSVKKVVSHRPFFIQFDKIAKRRGVFKIETIGDCYVCCSPDAAIGTFAACFVQDFGY